MSSHVVVIGGGISGLATAYRLLHPVTGTPPRVTVLEAEPRLGGKIVTATVAGLPIDTGPDSLLVRMPAVRTLLEELGLADEVEGPAPTGEPLPKLPAPPVAPAGLPNPRFRGCTDVSAVTDRSTRPRVARSSAGRKREPSQRKM